jgi:hypothetical protein
MAMNYLKAGHSVDIGHTSNELLEREKNFNGGNNACASLVIRVLMIFLDTQHDPLENNCSRKDKTQRS